jgi:hypothetical protein
MEMNFLSVLLSILVLWISVVISVRRAHEGNVPTIRSIPALDAIDESIGSAVERGRPVHFTPGFPSHAGGLISGAAGGMIASLLILGHVARKTAEIEAELITTWTNPEVVPVAEEIVKNAYMMAGVPENYQDEMVRYISRFQFGYTIGVLGILEREKVGTNIIIGPFMAEALIIAEAGNIVGALQVAGTTSVYQVAFLIVACDYCLVGEEMFAAGAYLSKDETKLGALLGQDLYKYALTALFLIGALLQLAGIQWLHSFFNV